jgi:hypothetical protein
MSSKNQIPFIELNGREIADTNLIIAALETENNRKHLDEYLSAREKDDAHAYHTLIEQSIKW